VSDTARGGDEAMTALLVAAGESLDDEIALHNAEATLLSGSRQGVRLSRYVLLQRIGAGGLGVVYAAYDPELHRKVAIKVVRQRGPVVPGAQDRLLREAQALARLSHPNVIAVYDVGTCVAPVAGVFVVMELVAGPTLAQWLTSESRRWSDTLEVLAAAGRGLLAAHEGGLVHRDFKPGNVLVADDGRVRVLDFGLAREHGDDAATRDDAAREDGETSAPRADRTEAGMVLGTLPYMAPEQHAGAAVDPRTDQFAFCVALFEALFRVRPFAGSSAAALHDAKREGRIVDVSSRGDVPRWLHDVVLRGLAALPERRWGSMRELLAALDRRRAGARRKWLVAGALAAGFAAVWAIVTPRVDACAGQELELAGAWDAVVRADVAHALRASGLAYAERSLSSVERTLDDYAANWVRLREQTCETARTHGQLLDASNPPIACLGRARVALSELTRVLASADATTVQHAVAAADGLPPLAECELTLAAGPTESVAPERLAEVDTLVFRAQVLVDAGRYAEASRAADEAVELARALAHDRSEARALLGRGRAAIGEPARATESAHQALVAAERAGADDLALDALAELVRATTRWGRFEEAERHAAHALARAERLGGEPRVRGLLLTHVAELAHARGRFADALAAARAAQLDLARAWGATHRRLADVHLVAGRSAAALDDRAAAAAEYERARAILVDAVGEDHPGVATAVENLGNLRLRDGRLDDAMALYQRALEIRRAAFGTDHAETAMSVGNIGNVLLSRGDCAGALERFVEVAAIHERTLGPEHPDLSIALNNAAGARACLGRHAEALADLRRAVEIREHAGGPEHPELVQPLTNLGWQLHAMGDEQAALAQHRRATALCERELGAWDFRIVDALEGTGVAEAALGRPELAAAAFERALMVQGAVAPLDRARVERLTRRLLEQRSR
jgi:tetratricopeptide (TPR) repeat protein